jgi:hypothetical protein
LNLPENIAEACAPLFEALPIDRAMGRLTGAAPVQTELVDQILKHPAITGKPDLAAGLWLYVDDLHRSHTVSQSISDVTGSLWHGIMHRREGDFSNSHHWMRRAESHPLVAGEPHLDIHGLVDAVCAARTDEPDLVARQRSEWQTVFEWCANRA